jgi:Rod binding domain-containing protein
VGRDFEAILVRQMLTQTKVAGKGGGYADMAVEALASSISAAGGLGMSQAIADSLSAHAHRSPPVLKSSESLPKAKVNET